MLIISNGAPKSGSSWLFATLKLLTDYGAPPREYLNPHWGHPSLLPKKLVQFLQNADYAHNNFLCKNHFGNMKQREMILSYPHVVVIGIKRDLYDTVVSFYYHLQRTENYKGSFEEYYWKNGRYFADEVIKYNKTWDDKLGSVYISEYEKFHSNFEHELLQISEVIKIRLNEEKIKFIKNETEFSRLKAVTRSRHLRKGKIGDWKNHFDEKMLLDIENIQRNGLKIPYLARVYNKARTYYRVLGKINTVIRFP